MTYNIYFDIAAIMLNTMLLVNIFIRKTFPTKAGNLYKLMLWCNLLSTICDLSSAFMISKPDQYPLFLNYAVNAGYLIFHNMTAIIFLLYVIRLVRHNRGTTPERIFWNAVMIYEIVIIITSPFTKLVFYFDESMHYTHGPLIITLYIAAFAIMIYALVLFVRHRHVLSTYQMATNIIFLSFLLGAIVFQYYYPSILIESYFAAIAFMMMNVALDSPEVYFYKNTYCFNQAAFNERTADMIKNNIKFRLLAFTYDDLKLYKKQYGDDAYQKIIFDTIRLCQQNYEQMRLCILSSDCFVIDLGSHTDAWSAAEKLTDVLRRKMKIGDNTVSLDPHFCELNYPGIYKDENEVNDAINSMLFDVYRNSGEKLICDSTDLLQAKHRESEVIHILHNAISTGGFEVYYQPIFNRSGGGFTAAEALVRLSKQEGEYIGPDEFIPVAEANGMILRIGEIVFEKVCRFLMMPDIEKHGIEYMEVNLSKIQLLDIYTVMRLERIADRYGISPERINFEITETVNLSPSEKKTINGNIDYLRKKGFTFSLDDYGSGYSNLSYIADSPFSIVKLDRDILWNAMDNPRHRIILNSCIDLVQKFGMKCVAEGVENPEMVQLLTEYGCDFFQGYHYSRPIPEKEFLHFLQTA